MKWLATILPLLISILLTSCDDDFNCERAHGNVETQEFHLSAIDGLSMGISGNVIITIGQVQSITVVAQREILEHLNTDITNGTWNIELDDCYKKYTKVNIYMTVPSLEYIGLAGSGSITTNSTIIASDIKTSLSGSGTIDLKIEANNVDTNISGSGNIELSGSTDQHDISISGSGNVNSYDLTSLHANVRISGSGNAYLHVENQLDVSITGSGSVIYDGNPTVNSTITGSGQVRKRI